MSAANRIIIASKNHGKIREIQEILKGIPFETAGMTAAGINDEIDENGKSYSENALIKAMHIYTITGERVISDDSGLEVDALSGRPGIYSARYAETSEKRIQRLLTELKGVPAEKRSARFVCVSCLLINRETRYFFHGTVEGFITTEPRGNNGFGFDPVFFLPEYNMTMAELSSEIKNSISHRAKAFSELRNFLISGNY
ncbi:MAG: RdgB/HAM1 family non-canonical purine NTP pyrophosphatase [Deltaproteobacteria bacterium]|nr:RdgB/HAM1 family non-canonical purine NTP pyrophosphatase [Deltaproteobacteria bacterium]